MDRRRQPPPASYAPTSQGLAPEESGYSPDAYHLRQQQPHKSNRYSLQSDGPSVSTVSPYQSPTSPEFPSGGGLAPRPSSYVYGAPIPADTVKKSSSRRRQETKGQQRLSLDKPLPPNPPPTAPDVPRGAPLISYPTTDRTEPDSGPQSALLGSFSTRSREAQVSRSLSGAGPSVGRHRREGSRSQDQPPSVLSDPVVANSRGQSMRSDPRTEDTGRRDSTGDSSARQRREWVPDRSPLQKLKLTVEDISKEEQRAHAEEAELLARDARAGRSSQSRRISRTSENPQARAAPKPTSEGDHLAEAGLVRNLSHKQKDRLQRSATIESRKPRDVESSGHSREGDFEYQEQEYRPKQASTERDMAKRKSLSRDPAVAYPASRSGASGHQRNTSRSTRPVNAYQDPSLDGERSDTRQNGQATRSSVSQSRDLDSAPQPGVRSSNTNGVKYEVPPQTGGAVLARNRVGSQLDGTQDSGRKHFSDYMHLHRRHQPRADGRPATQTILDDWKRGGTARLSKADLNLEKGTSAEQKAWWEQSERSRRQANGSSTRRNPITPFDGANPSVPVAFEPPLYLKCGPLLRYTGIASGETEVWRGSVLIVTNDSVSSYDTAPTLRLFADPTTLLPPPPPQVDGETGELPPEYIDPIAGLRRMSRTGGALFVKPVEHIKEELDLSHIEDNNGLFEDKPSMPQDQDRDRVRLTSGEQAGKYREVQGARLHTERGCTFWRFKIEVELTSVQMRVAYRINDGLPIGFWVPARGQSMNIMFHSCNGFSMSVDSDKFSGPDPMWRDVLNTHQTSPIHVMLGGGDQIYNDRVMKDCPSFEAWLNIRNPVHKHGDDFTPQMQEEMESFYLERYSSWFSQGLFAMAMSQIPSVNIWDDHDIIDGFGSYPHHFMSSPVFTGLGAVAYKYYMLFQHHSISAESEADEPSWLLGAARGPYINELSRSVFVNLGNKVAFLGLDCRTERMRDEILSEQTYDLVFDRCNKEIQKGRTKHLIVLLGVPIAYPRLVFLEQLLTSRLMDPIKAVGRTGILGGLLNSFDGGVEILDDLDDHWTAKNHKQERNWFIQELQELAAAKSVRITILGGDVHLAAVGRFFSNPKLNIPKDYDHRYMYNVISSAIVNTPPPEIMGDILNKRNKVHHLDRETDEDMIPLFTHDVDRKARNNKRLLPRRNWCSIKEYAPGHTPPPTPPDASPERSRSPQQQPGRLTRTLSLSRKDILPPGLVRRLSNRGGRPNSYINPSQRNGSADYTLPPSASADNYFPPHPAHEQSPPPPAGPRPGRTPFHRQPTDLGQSRRGRTLAKAGEGHVNFEHGLEVILNLEVSQKDPAGITTPYRLLIPALWYEGGGDPNPQISKTATNNWMKRALSRRNTKVAKESDAELHNADFA